MHTLSSVEVNFVIQSADHLHNMHLQHKEAGPSQPHMQEGTTNLYRNINRKFAAGNCIFLEMLKLTKTLQKT